MAELITERIRRNATELRLHGIATDPDELIDRAEHGRLGYREFLVVHPVIAFTHAVSTLPV
jgi:hypothetical protein